MEAKKQLVAKAYRQPLTSKRLILAGRYNLDRQSLINLRRFAATLEMSLTDAVSMALAIETHTNDKQARRINAELQRRQAKWRKIRQIKGRKTYTKADILALDESKPMDEKQEITLYLNALDTADLLTTKEEYQQRGIEGYYKMAEAGKTASAALRHILSRSLAATVLKHYAEAAEREAEEAIKAIEEPTKAKPYKTAKEIRQIIDRKKDKAAPGRGIPNA